MEGLKVEQPKAYCPVIRISVILVKTEKYSDTTVQISPGFVINQLFNETSFTAVYLLLCTAEPERTCPPPTIHRFRTHLEPVCKMPEGNLLGMWKDVCLPWLYGSIQLYSCLKKPFSVYICCFHPLDKLSSLQSPAHALYSACISGRSILGRSDKRAE